MKKIIPLDKHIVLTSSTEIDEICKPLKIFGINYFSFIRTFKDMSHIRLSNNPLWTRHYYDKCYYKIILEQVPKINGHILWSCINRYPLFYDAAETYNIDNGIVIVESHDEIVERYFFGSTRDNKKINGFYCYNLDLMHRFIYYFKEKAENIIKNAEKQKIYIPTENLKKSSFDKQDEKKKQFLESTRIKRFSLNFNGKDFYFSKRQAQLLLLMSKGLSSKQISKMMGATPRTIDYYRHKLKEKTGNKTEDILYKISSGKIFSEETLFDKIS